MHHSADELKKRSVTSVLSLFFQSGYAAVLGLVANLVLTILLTPAIFGIYFTVLSVIALLNYFSDIGLAASIIQKKELTVDDVKTTFTIQQSMIITLIFLGFLLTPVIERFYAFPSEGRYLFWALLIAFFLSSLKTIPSVFLERSVQFQKIVMVQIIENTIFYLSVIICAVSGLGLTSFTVSVLFRALVGVIAMYSLSFWRPRLGISRSSLRTLLSYGIPFQASSFLALFKDDLITLYLGKVLGFESLGYIGWAKKWAETPVRIIMDNITRVLFPVISRMQGDKDRIRIIIEKIIHYQTLILAPTLVGLVLMIRPLVDIIPRYGKWEPAIPLLFLFAAASFFSTYSTPFINLFNALGKVRISFAFMLFWTITTWVLTPVFTRSFGYYGFPFVQLVLAGSSVMVLVKARSFLSFSVVPQFLPPVLSAAIMGFGVWMVVAILGGGIGGILAGIGAGIILYSVCIHFIFRINILDEIRWLMRK